MIRLLLGSNLLLLLLVLITLGGHFAYRQSMSARLAEIEQQVKDADLMRYQEDGTISRDVARVEDLLLRLGQISVVVGEVQTVDLDQQLIELRRYAIPLDRDSIVGQLSSCAWPQTAVCWPLVSSGWAQRHSANCRRCCSQSILSQ